MAAMAQLTDPTQLIKIDLLCHKWYLAGQILIVNNDTNYSNYKPDITHIQDHAKDCSEWN